MPRDPLPIDDALPDLLAALRTAGAAVLRAPTGAGKTTRVPPALVESGLAAGMVLMLEPRRVAARAAARRMAIEHGSPLGDTYGYQVRFDRKASARTRVLVVTPGILLRLVQDNPFLEGIAAVVFDEFHERGLESDLALGMVKLVRQTVRPDLLCVVMSATIDFAAVSAYLGNAPVVSSEGRTFPVDVTYRPRVEVADAIRDVLRETDGDVLAFLPGLREIRQTASALDGVDAVVLPLHGDLPPEQQDRALQRSDRRKVVLATNVAETSVTVEGVTAVVDSGTARQMEFDASVGMDRLRLVPVSRASADQRAGRAGRTRPGVCVRLWDELGHRSRAAHTDPEIRRVDLCGAVLQLLALGESDVSAFPWLDSPRQETVEQSLRLLEQLQLLDGRTLTDLGKQVSRLPVHPRLGRMLIEGERLGCADRAALAAALLSERDPFLRDGAPPPSPTFSDVLDRVEAMEAFERSGTVGRLHRGGAFAVLDVRDHLLRVLANPERQRRGDSPNTLRVLANPESQRRGDSPNTPSLTLRVRQDDVLCRALLAAFPDRVARRRERGDRRAVTVGGRGVKLAPQSGVIEPELFVCVDVDAGGVDSFVRQASGVEREWLPPEQISTRIEVAFDEQAERLAARKRTRFNDLVLEEVHAHIGDESEAARVLAVAASERLEKVLPPPDSDAGRFRTRVRCLRTWMPELNLPAFDASDLGELLEHLCRGKRSLGDLRHGPWLDLMRGQLSYQQSQAVEREAPDRLEVPSGSHIQLEYEEGRPPVLAARIQELFGLTETPRIGGGRAKVLLHLLAPNYRPQQVTDDLASFWANTYPQVRKELRGRYPKHSWPDDPLTAEAVRGAKRRPAGS